MRALALVLCLAVTSAFAQDAVSAPAPECPVPEGATGVAKQPAAERLAFLKKAIEAEARKVNRWRAGWGGTFAGMSMAQIIIAPIMAPDDRVDWWVGAATSIIGVAFSLIDPHESITAGPAWLASVEKGGEPCALIAEGERILFADAAKERFGTSWLLHAGNILLNGGVTLVLGLGWKHWVSGAINGGIGAALGEASLFTAPRGLVDAAREYREGAPARHASLDWTIGPSMAPGSAGLSFFVRF